MTRWTEKQLAEHLKRHGVPGAAILPVDTSDPPFLPPLDEVTIDLPPPISVNRLRMIDWGGHKRAKRWKAAADKLVMAAKCRAVNPVPKNGPPFPRFEVWIILDERRNNLDADNSHKMIIDYLKRINLITDDAKKYMRWVHIGWGVAPEGCRLILRPAA